MKVKQKRIACTKLQKLTFGSHNEAFLFDYNEKTVESENNQIELQKDSADNSIDSNFKKK
ncbi:hypothetical protein QEJ31_04390 [Pigmentibacter sp. JX0631]|uniref:hypothetical protein n=1 Tax=Pigmentibacter sp. JX0631 TaxID=2976982 RepID=UPI0024698F42|nr:hypothetical protein [Pigmentibacter sp. JX0631]WGL60834.1 hypothetical protein QEJ31_04390 [Pigmentibacter sp. JX0631]